MKKWLLILVMLLVTAFIASYVLIPKEIKLENNITIGINAVEARNHLTNINLRNKWIGSNANDSFFYLGNTAYAIHASTTNSALIVNTKTDLSTTQSELLLIPQGVDSTIFIWATALSADNNNPIKKIKNYLQASSIKNNFKQLIDSFNNYTRIVENVYGFPIESKKVVDTVLIATRKKYSQYPTNKEIYEQIAKLEKYAIENNATITNAPMLNMSIIDSSHYQCTVALPLNKTLKNTADFYIAKMVPGNILVETVKGGPATIEIGFKRLTDYFLQHKMTSPALHFESLITNRLLETDTTKWITKIYYPIF
jgi:hypothetical protein